MLQQPVGCEACANAQSVGGIQMGASRMRPGVWRQSLGAVARGCDFEGGISARAGETEAEFFARAEICDENTKRLIEAEERADVELTNVLTRGGSAILDEVLDRWLGEDEPQRAAASPGLSTGAKVGLAVGGTAVGGLILWAIFK